MQKKDSKNNLGLSDIEKNINNNLFQIITKELIVRLDKDFLDFIKLRKTRDMAIILNYLKGQDLINTNYNKEFTDYLIQNSLQVEAIISKLRSIKTISLFIKVLCKKTKVINFEILNNLYVRERKINSLTDWSVLNNFLKKKNENQNIDKLDRISDKSIDYTSIEIDEKFFAELEKDIQMLYE